MPTLDSLLRRANSMRSRATLYWAGSGGLDPQAPTPNTTLEIGQGWPALSAEQQALYRPWAEQAGIDVDDPASTAQACDCSGFVCWALGFSRKQRPASHTTDDGWISTDTIWGDAMRSGRKFQRLARASVGCLMVYPKEGSGETFGHVGIVSAVGADGEATDVVHCSASNFKVAPFDAIKTTAPDVFLRQQQMIYAWCRDVLTTPPTT